MGCKFNPIYDDLTIRRLSNGKMGFSKVSRGPTGSKAKAVQHAFTRAVLSVRGQGLGVQGIRNAVAQKMTNANFGGKTPRPYTAERTLARLERELKESGITVPGAAGTAPGVAGRGF